MKPTETAVPVQEGFLIVDKPSGMTSFDVVARLRRCLKVQKIGHGGTLDPFATGVLVILVGRAFTKRADEFLADNKEYFTTFHLGEERDSHDIDGQVIATSDAIPSREEVEKTIQALQGITEQIPPMFSAKKIGGKRLYEIARKGGEVARLPCRVTISMDLVRYEYPEIDLRIRCSKGTYVRVIAHDLGIQLGSYAYVKALRRTRSGRFTIEESIPLQTLMNSEETLWSSLRHLFPTG